MFEYTKCGASLVREGIMGTQELSGSGIANRASVALANNR